VTSILPNPFLDSVVPLATDAAAASKRPPVGAAAGPISEPPMATGGHQDPAATAQNPTEAAGSEDYRFVLDEELFWAEIEPVPLSLQWAG
jgi:hypothetical protein